VVDRARRFVTWNRVFAASARVILGRDLIVGDAMQTMVVPDQWPIFTRLIERAFEGEAIIHVFDVVLANGLRRQYEMSLNVARPNPDADHVVILSRNVTGARAEVEASHRLAEQRRTLLEAIPDAITVLRPDGTITDFHPATGVPTPVGRSGLIGRNLLSFDQVAGDELRSRLDAAFATGETQAFEYDAIVDGVVRRREGRISVVGEAEALLIVRDVTEGRELTKRLVTSDRMAALGILAAGVAHELNNPLMYVSAHLENLRDGLSPAATADALAAASEGVERMASIVRELTAYAREAPGPGVADVGAAIDFAERITRRSLAPLARIVRGPSVQGHVAIGEARLGQVLVNLLLNAGDAIGDAARGKRGEIRVSVAVGNDRFVVEVADNGCGMTDEVARRVFDPFFTTKARGRGTGLGLWVSLGIVRDAGGDLQVESESGVGSRFRVILPRVDPALSTSASAPPAAVGRRLLIVDDDASVAAGVSALLGRDHEIVTAAGAGAARERLDVDTAFDLVLCDLHMPGEDGVSFLVELRSRPRLSHLRCALMTGGAITAGQKERLAAIGVAFVNKPFRRDAIDRLLVELADVEVPNSDDK
jgi:signal transduction histidine kinase/CheY-like chemotaxis protein